MKEGLIIAVQNRPALWDKCHKHHHNRTILDKEWKAVATELNSTDKYVKLVWKNLRDEFRKQFNKTPRSGDAAPDATSTWKYFDSMLFLRDQFLPRKSTGNLSLLTNDSDAHVTEDLVEEQVDSPCEMNEQFDVDPDLTQLDIRATPPVRNVNKTPLSTLDATSRTGFKRRLTMQAKVGQELVNIEKEKLKLKMNKMEQVNKNNEDVAFFNSLLPHVDKLDPRKKMMFRMEVQRLLFNMAYPPQYETLHHQSAPAMNYYSHQNYPSTDNSTVTDTSTRTPTPLTSPDNDEPLNWCSAHYTELE